MKRWPAYAGAGARVEVRQAEHSNEADHRFEVGLNELLDRQRLERDPLGAACDPLPAKLLEAELVMKRSGCRVRRSTLYSQAMVLMPCSRAYSIMSLYKVLAIPRPEKLAAMTIRSTYRKSVKRAANQL